MAEETLREFVAINYTEFDSEKHSGNKDIADLTVDSNAVKLFSLEQLITMAADLCKVALLWMRKYQ